MLGSLLIFFLASLIGIPFTGGFFGKFISFSTAIGGGAIWLVMIGLLNSGLAAAYYLRLALVAAQSPEQEVKANDCPRSRWALRWARRCCWRLRRRSRSGILPGTVLRAADAGAHTLEAPPAENAPVNPMLPQ